MGKKKKSEPVYLISPINTKLLNYGVYKMSEKEKISTFLMLFAAGGVIGFLFYGGLFKSDGVATIATYISNAVIFCIGGLLANKMLTTSVVEGKKKKRTSKLKVQFRDLLAAMSAAMSSGMNVNDSLNTAYKDLCTQYSENSYIAKEVLEMINGIQNNIPIEDTMKSFGERSGVDDISNFGIVFSVCYRTGGNLKEVIKRSSDIIGEKMIIVEEIETKMTSNKTQLKFMMFIPVVMMIILKSMSTQFAEAYASAVGVIAVTVSAVFFIAAYKVGNKIMDIEG